MRGRGEVPKCKAEGHACTCIMQVNQGRSRPRLYFWQCERCNFLLVGDRHGNEDTGPDATKRKEAFMALRDAALADEGDS